jgi:hypothetical protein
MNQLNSSPLGAASTSSVAARRQSQFRSIRVLLEEARDWFATLVREDPVIAALLTEPFLKEFKGEFDRRCREHVDAAARQEGSAALRARIRATRCDTVGNVFDGLVKQYPGIDELDYGRRALVITRLMQHCELPGSGLF